MSNGDSGVKDGEEDSEDKYSDRPRHPEDLEGVPELCLVCSKDTGEEDSPLECDKVCKISVLFARVCMFGFRFSNDLLTMILFGTFDP